jgi:hypothetical protein
VFFGQKGRVNGKINILRGVTSRKILQYISWNCVKWVKYFKSKQRKKANNLNENWRPREQNCYMLKKINFFYRVCLEEQ